VAPPLYGYPMQGAARLSSLGVVRRGAVARIILAGLVVGVLVTLVAVLIPWLPDSASEQMDRIEFVYWFATVICIGIFALVAGMTIYAVRAFRVQPDDLSDGPPIHGNTRLEILWTVVPSVLVIAIGIVSAVVLTRNGEAGTNPLKIHVYAQQFSWRFEYPASGNLKTNELVMPLGRTVQFEMESADVIHSFFIPEMGQKQDLVPGIETSIVVTPTRTGRFALVCTELCGLGHSTMRAPVRVVSQSDFTAWVKEQRSGSGGGGGADGSAVFASQGCGSCHTFAPAGSNGKIGPDLDNLAKAAATAGKSEAEFVRESIVDPGAYIAPGYQDGVMPGSYGKSLSPAEIGGLVKYLTETKG
jgi:cytochrome c oxidase subunit II